MRPSSPSPSFPCFSPRSSPSFPRSSAPRSSQLDLTRALHGHPTIWPLRAACPRWPGYTETHSAVYNRTVARARELGYLAVLNTAVTPLSGWGGLEQLDDALDRTPCPHANNWRTRLRIAVAFLRAVAFLHNSGTSPALPSPPSRRAALSADSAAAAALEPQERSSTHSGTPSS